MINHNPTPRAQLGAKIPILDPQPEVAALYDELMAAIAGVLRSGEYINGANVKAFEEAAAAYLGARHAIGVNSGTDALVIALRAMGVGPGDEVVTTPFTFFATAEAISILGATPVFADIEPGTFNVDPARVEALIGPRTKAIVPVHLYGNAADMDALMALADARGLGVVEDVAQAFGGTHAGTKVGTIGAMGAYSFFPSKNLGTYGDGGLITTNDDDLADTARMLRVHGARKKYYNERVGYNSRLDELHAAILRVKLPRIDASNDGRRRAAARYDAMLAGIPGITTPVEAPRARHVYHQYTIRVAGGRRDELQARLADEGIMTMIYYPVPVHLLPLYKGQAPRLPVAEAAMTEVLSLPIWPTIDAATQERVADAIARTMRRR